MENNNEVAIEEKKYKQYELQREISTHVLIWLKTIYISELSFFFHLPLFVELISEDYKHPSPAFQLVIFLLRTSLNFVALIFLLDDVKHQSVWVENSDKVFVSTIESEYSSVGWILILVSFVLYYISYVHQKLHLTTNIEKTGNAVVFPGVLYFVCHTFSVLNFSFDFPSASIPATVFTRVSVCIINLICLLAILFVVFFEKPFAQAWGCYPSYDSIYDYNYGVCPAFLNRPLSSACDEPGVNCAKGLNTEHEEFNNLKAFVHAALSVSFGIYFISVQPKVEFIKAETNRILLLVNKQKKE